MIRLEGKRQRLALHWISSLFALMGLAGLVLHIFELLDMSYALIFIGAPSLFALLGLACYAKWVDDVVFVNCILVGIGGGLIATAAYDISRLVLYAGGVFDFDPFQAIPIFGGWIIHAEPTTSAAIAVGWVYHFWNGISFAIFYTLIFGRRSWLFGLAYGLVVELAMLGLFPFFLKFKNLSFDLIAISLIGHLFYGAALGYISQKRGMNWDDNPPSKMPDADAAEMQR